MVGDSNYYSVKEALNDRYLRKLEVLYAVTRDAAMPYRRVTAWLSDTRRNLNKGNSARTMKQYLVEWRDGGFITLEDDQVILTSAGEELLKSESIGYAKWLRPLTNLREHMDRVRREENEDSDPPALKALESLSEEK